MIRPRPRRSRRENFPLARAPDAVEYATLRERVASLDEDVHAISADVSHLRNTMATKSDVNNVHAALTNFSQTVQGSFTAINEKLATQGKPQWNLYIMAASLMVAVMVALGGIAFWPIKQAQDTLFLELKEVRAHMVPRVEHIERWRQSERSSDRNERRIDVLEKDATDTMRETINALRQRLRVMEAQQK